MSVDKITAISYTFDENEAFAGTRANAFKDFPSGGIKIETEVDEYADPWDFNRDGRVDIADLTFAQAFYQVSEGDSRWALANERGIDVNHDATIDLADLIVILNHIYSL